MSPIVGGEGCGYTPASPTVSRVMGFQLPPLCDLQVVVLNGCCAVFSALAMVLCDPGGESKGLRSLEAGEAWAGEEKLFHARTVYKGPIHTRMSFPCCCWEMGSKSTFEQGQDHMTATNR